MKRVILSFLFLLSVPYALFSQVNSEDFLQVVTLESISGTIAHFTSIGMGESREEAEINAEKSLLYTLLFSGIDGVNNGNPLVKYENKSYTNSFFNRQSRYKIYIEQSKRVGHFEKVGNIFQGTMRISIRLAQLQRDVTKNTGAVQPGSEEMKSPRPSIIVVPFKRTGENYSAILENDFDKRAAIGAVKKGFEEQGIKTIDLHGWLEASKRAGQYSDNIGTAESNDKQLLLTSGADVYVVVDIKKDITSEGSRVSLIMEAHETSTGISWGAENGWTNRFKTSSTDLLCTYAVRDNLPGFLAQIERNYNQPINASLRISVDGNSYVTIFDKCDNGKRILDVVRDYLDANCYQGDYHQQGEVAEYAWFDRVVIPRIDSKGYKMNAAKFAYDLREVLISSGVQIDPITGLRIEGNTIMLTIM